MALTLPFCSSRRLWSTKIILIQAIHNFYSQIGAAAPQQKVARSSWAELRAPLPFPRFSRARKRSRRTSLGLKMLPPAQIEEPFFRDIAIPTQL